jgi:uncharacterized protein (DUF2235 family)
VPRRLMFFFDGSSNKAAAPTDIIPTNVLRLNRAFTYGFGEVPQITFYFSGVGTRRDYSSAATGRGFDEIVIEAFVNLASNYMEGDQVYLFGFSRGAAAARALSGVISDPGLLPVDNLDAFPELWKYFVDSSLGEARRSQLFAKIEPRLFYPRPKIRFLGAFDTVAGSSWDRLNLFSKVRFRNLHLDEYVEHAVQILALDDDRNPSFSPLIWDKKYVEGQVLEQIWMPGVHSDVGGPSDGRFLANVALMTMVERLKKYCAELEWDEDYLDKIRQEIKNTKAVQITSERSGFLRKFLGRGSRLIGNGSNEYNHSLFTHMIGREFVVRGDRQRYSPNNYCDKLDILRTDFDDDLGRICKRVLGS